MAKFKNISPLGDLDVPLLGKIVLFNETVEVSEDLTKGFLDQTEDWESVDGTVPSFVNTPTVTETAPAAPEVETTETVVDATSIEPATDPVV
jgi:hypothetical protein